MGLFYKITAGLIAVLMFTISLGFGVNTHYCNGELDSISILGQANACEMKCCDDLTHNQEPSFSQTSCCSNLSFLTKSHLYNDHKEIVGPAEHLQLIPFVVLDFNPVFDGFESFNSRILKYRPPLIEEDISVLYETFLI